MLARDYVLRGRPDIDRATWIKNAVTLCWGDRSDIDEFNAREADGAVVTTFVLTLYQDPLTCGRATIRSLITDVWTQQNGEWLLAVRHSGPIGAAGQDPIAQQFRREAPPPPRWEGTSEVSFVSTGGNSDVRTTGAAAQLIYRPGVWETAVNGVFVRSVADGLESARFLTAQLRQGAQIHPRVDVFGRSSYRRDRFAGIEHRYALDAGLGYKIPAGETHRLKIDGGVGYLAEQRAVGPRLNSATLSLVKTWRWQILPPVVIANDAMATMLLEETGSWRLNNVFSLTTSLTGIFSLKLSHSTNFLNQPVPGFGRTDVVTSVALVVKFEKR